MLVSSSTTAVVFPIVALLTSSLVCLVSPSSEDLVLASGEPSRARHRLTSGEPRKQVQNLTSSQAPSTGAQRGVSSISHHEGPKKFVSKPKRSGGRQRELVTGNSMRIEIQPTKRPQNGSSNSTTASLPHSNTALPSASRPKKFKSSHRSQAFLESSNSSNTSHQRFASSAITSRSSSLSLHDDDNNNSNNNNTDRMTNNLDDVNNNSIHSGNQSGWRRNISSINGTIDLSQYEQSDVDRLYGDALLVYFKNFNELSTFRLSSFTRSFALELVRLTP